MVTVPRLVTVAGGVFAPGHLGELTRYLPFELVDDVLEMTGAVQRRMRMLPSRVGMYFILAMTLFPGLGYLRVWDKMTAALEDLELPRPSEKALRDLRRRIGPATVKALFETIAVPLAPPGTPGVFYRGLRTVAFDGLNSVKVPDSDRNRSWLGKMKGRLGLAGYPAMRIVALAVTGTDGSRIGDHYRLITTLLDHRRYPAAELIQLYHERWEIEVAYLALRHTLLGGDRKSTRLNSSHSSISYAV